MTKEALKEALVQIVSHKTNLARFYARFEREAKGMTKDEFVAWLVDKIYSDVMLEQLNLNMRPIPVCDLTCFKIRVGHEYVPYMEELNGKDRIMPKVWHKPMVLLGKYDSPVYDSYGSIFYANGPTFYIDEDGAIKYVYEYELAYQFGGLPVSDCATATYRKLCGKTKEEVWMNAIYSILPDWMQGWWEEEQEA